MNRTLHLLCSALLCLPAILASPAVIADTGNYRVEVLVFNHRHSLAEPVAVDQVRTFHELFELDEIGETPMSGLPVQLSSRGGTFDGIRRRLERLDDYQPLALIIFEQNRIDYHPPVRLHNNEVIAEELHFPGDVIYVDLTANDMLQPFVSNLYRLDGSIQLQRTRFLHLDLDLEYRIDDPAWAEAFPPLQGQPATGGVDPFTPANEQESVVEPGSNSSGNSGDLFSSSEDEFSSSEAEEEPPEPFRIHRLVQSRQVKTGTIQYFDSEFLGVLVRVTPTEANPDN